jgi:hypothetical protein
MEFYIRELPDGQATLMTRDGLYLFTFRNLDSARQAGEITDMSDGDVSCSVFG